MGITERKERERHEMMQVILEAAMELYLEKGTSNVSIRKIADKIEYSPATIYSYYKNRDEIFWGMHNLAFEKFIASAQGQQEADLATQLRMAMHRYIAFAAENPELYDIMFIMQAPMRGCPQKGVVPMAERSFEKWKQFVALCVEQKVLKPGPPNLLAFTLWTYLHGISSLLIRDRLDILPETERTAAIQESIATVLNNFCTEI